MAFTKDRDPSDTKFAMIDRSIAHMVRSIGKSAHTDNEFKTREKHRTNLLHSNRNRTKQR